MILDTVKDIVSEGARDATVLGRMINPRLHRTFQQQGMFKSTDYSQRDPIDNLKSAGNVALSAMTFAPFVGAGVAGIKAATSGRRVVKAHKKVTAAKAQLRETKRQYKGVSRSVKKPAIKNAKQNVKSYKELRANEFAEFRRYASQATKGSVKLVPTAAVGVAGSMHDKKKRKLAQQGARTAAKLGGI